MVSPATPQVRPPAVAGLFYPADPETLRLHVRALLEAPEAPPAPALPGPLKALLVPHAGYVYSGHIAASAYRLLGPLSHTITRVVLLGPTHRVPVRGLALPEGDAFATPLGTIPLDGPAMGALADLPQVSRRGDVHREEHALEVQLPFLQVQLGHFHLLPLAVGMASPEEVAQVLERLWGGPETLILISSDLSHYLTYGEARERDSQTWARIQALTPDLRPEEACGALALDGLLLEARRHGLSPLSLDLRNSGDTAGDKHRVVGYGAMAFYAPPSPTQGDAHGPA